MPTWTNIIGWAIGSIHKSSNRYSLTIRTHSSILNYFLHNKTKYILMKRWLFNWNIHWGSHECSIRDSWQTVSCSFLLFILNAVTQFTTWNIHHFIPSSHLPCQLSSGWSDFSNKQCTVQFLYTLVHMYYD